MDTLITMTDEQLVTLYLEGNNLAFDCLLNRHKLSVFNYIYFIVKNRELAEDIFQETFVKAIVTIKQGRYVENGKFRGWIARIAHNLVIDSFRHERSDNTISNDEAQHDLFNNSALCENTIEDALVQTQISSDIRKLVSFLPELQRQVVEMRYYQDLSFKEIAEQTGVSINTSLGRMRYAIMNMRRLADENRMVLTN